MRYADPPSKSNPLAGHPRDFAYQAYPQYYIGNLNEIHDHLLVFNSPLHTSINSFKGT